MQNLYQYTLSVLRNFPEVLHTCPSFESIQGHCKRAVLACTVSSVRRQNLLILKRFCTLVVVRGPQTEIYVEIDDVPVVGISASERVSLTASATVNSDAAMDTLVSYSAPRTPLAFFSRSVYTLQVPLA